SRIVTLSGGNNQPNNVHYLQGTSFSAPFVSGIAGLLLSAEPGLTNVQLWNILNMTAVQPVGSGYNTNYGWGVVNARNAIAALNQPLISVDSYPTSVSSSSTFGVTWSILVLSGGVAFIPQRRAARARRAVARPQMWYPPSYYVQAAQPSQPPPVAYPAQTVTPRIEPQIAGPPTPTQTPTVVQPVAPATIAQPAAARKRCPSCGTMVNADNMFCFFCGNRFR